MRACDSRVRRVCGDFGTEETPAPDTRPHQPLFHHENSGEAEKDRARCQLLQLGYLTLSVALAICHQLLLAYL